MKQRLPKHSYRPRWYGGPTNFYSIETVSAWQPQQIKDALGKRPYVKLPRKLKKLIKQSYRLRPRRFDAIYPPVGTVVRCTFQYGKPQPEWLLKNIVRTSFKMP